MKKSINDEYESLVIQAKELVTKREMVQLQLAKLAVKACTIKHGGRGNYYTLTDFCKDTGLSFKSLSRWVISYRTVVSKIPEEIKTVDDWNKASKLSVSLTKKRNLINKANGNTGSKRLFSEDLEIEKSEVLRAFKQMDETSQCLRYTHESLSRAIYNLGKIDCYPKEDEKYLLNINQNCGLFIEMASKLQERTIYLMGRVKK